MSVFLSSRSSTPCPSPSSGCFLFCPGPSIGKVIRKGGTCSDGSSVVHWRRQQRLWSEGVAPQARGVGPPDLELVLWEGGSKVVEGQKAVVEVQCPDLIGQPGGSHDHNCQPADEHMLGHHGT